VANDWRVTVTLREQDHAGRVTTALREHEVTDSARGRLGSRVAVSEDGPQLFLYAGSEDAAREAQQVVGEVLAGHGLAADGVTLERWHPVEEEWEDAGVALPQTDAERQAEHQRLEREETAESLATGHATWEVRVELPSHRAAADLARRVQAEGRPVIRRWTLLVLGANDEDDANDLAQLIRREAPAGATVQAQEIGPVLPFVVTGRL
jgi:hypothetical protein